MKRALHQSHALSAARRHPWGAGIGAVIGGVGGAIVGGWAGRNGGELLVDQLYPPADTAFIGSFQ